MDDGKSNRSTGRIRLTKFNDLFSHLLKGLAGSFTKLVSEPMELVFLRGGLRFLPCGRQKRNDLICIIRGYHRLVRLLVEAFEILLPDNTNELVRVMRVGSLTTNTQHRRLLLRRLYFAHALVTRAGE